MINTIMNTGSVQNIHFVLTLGSNAGPNSLFIFGQIVMLDKTNSQFQDKYDVKSFEHTTALMSLLHIVYQSKQNHIFVSS